LATIALDEIVVIPATISISVGENPVK